MIYVTESRGSKTNMTLIEAVFANANVTVHVRPNPGYNEGAVLAVVEAFQNHWFDSYEWVIRLNPDVMIRNDIFILERINDKATHGIFVDCLDVACPAGNKCQGRKIHTDFFAVRPDSVTLDALVKARERDRNAERMATHSFSSVVTAGADSWLPGTGPHHGRCRVIGESSPVIHVNDINAVYPACLSWYE